MKVIYIPKYSKPKNKANYLLGGFKSNKEKTMWLRDIYKRMVEYKQSTT